jgi:DedD protein
MAFFKFRLPGQTSTASASEAVNASPAESLEVLRKRARHRLMGSVVLVLVAVIGFPLLFDTQPRPVSLNTPIVIPERASSQAASASGAVAPVSGTVKPTSAVDVPSGPLPSGSVLDANEEVVPSINRTAEKNQNPVESPPVQPNAGGFKVDFGKTGATTPAVNESKTDSLGTSSPSDKGREEAAKARALLDGKEVSKNSEERWIIQVGAFTDPAKVRETRQKLEASGLKTYTQVIEAKDGKRTRVRVGPFASKEEVDKVNSKIQKLQLETSILKL